MFSRRKLLAILGIGVSAFVLSSTESLAARGQTFAPATDWSISRIDPKNGGASYCTLARRFNGNTVITFARNTSGEGTIAVDFQQSLFDPNQTYRIGLQAGDGLKREFMTRPATANAIVLRTGQDPQFFNALSQSNELGVFLDTTRHAFTIPDFGSGTNQLATCIGDAPKVTPQAPRNPNVAAVTANAITPAAGNNNKNAAESDAVKELRAELNQLRQENAGIVQSLKQGGVETTQDAGVSQTAENQELVARLAKLESEKNGLVEKLQSERSRQQQEAQDEASLKQALEDQKSLKTMLESERQQRAQLEASLGEQTAEAEKRGELKARIDALESSNAELKTLRETLETERSKRLAAEKMLQDQKNASASTLEEQERLRSRLSELENQNKSLQQTAADVEGIKAQLEDTGTRASMEQARREAAEKALQEMQMTASEREANLAKMQSQLVTERSKMAQAESAEKAELTKKHADEIARLNADMEKLRAEDAADAARAAEINAQIADKQEKAAALDMKAATEQARREAAEKALATLQQEREAAIAKMTSELESARKPDPAKEAEVAKLKLDLETARKEAMEATASREEVTAKQAQIAKLQEELAAANKKAEAALTTANMGESAKAEEISRLNDEIEKLRKENMAKVVDADGASTPKMKEVSDRLAELEGRNSDLVDQLKAAQARVQAADKMAMNTTSNDPATNAKIVEIGRKAEADRRELQALLEAEQARREKLEGIMAKGGSENDRLKEMSAQISELNKRNVNLESRLREAGNNAIAPAAGAEDESISNLRKQLAVLKSDNQMLAEKLATSGSKGKGAEKIVYAGDDQMADELAESKSSLASVMAERDEYRGLLQRERAAEKEGGKKTDKKEAKVVDKGANARITELEAERVDLIRKLEFERARLESIASGKEAAPAVAGASEGEINNQLAAVEAEKQKLKKQLEIAQNDVIEARTKAMSGKAGASDEDIRQLLQENKKLQAELAASGSGGANADSRAMQTEIAALRAQNNVLSQEINKRLAAAPSRAQMDNVAAEANYKVKEAKQIAGREVAGDLNKANNRFQQAEQENIRLAQELAKARMQPIVDQQQAAQVPAPQPQQVVAAATPVSPPQDPIGRMNAQMAQQMAQQQVAQQQMAQPPVQQPIQQQQPLMAAAVPSPMPMQQKAAPSMFQTASVAPLPNNVGPNGSDIAGYLKRAGIPMTAGFEKVGKVATPQFGAFRWDTGVVFGTAEQQVMPVNNFEQAVNNYINKTQSRCSGTFDKSFDPSQMTQHKQFAIADVACVMPDGTGAGAAMLFFYKDGVFTAVAHEGDVSQFDQAMTTRDQLAKFMDGVL